MPLPTLSKRLPNRSASICSDLLPAPTIARICASLIAAPRFMKTCTLLAVPSVDLMRISRERLSA